MTIDAETAIAALTVGESVRMKITSQPPHPDDPELILYAREGTVYSLSIGGWSSGCLEPVTGLGRPFLVEYLNGDHSPDTQRTLTLAPDYDHLG